MPTPVLLGFPCGSAGKGCACNGGDLGLIPGLGRSPVEGKGYPLQYSDLENSVDCIVYGVAKSRPRLSNFHFHFQSTSCKMPGWMNHKLESRSPGEMSTMSGSLESRLVSEISFVFILKEVHQLDCI